MMKKIILAGLLTLQASTSFADDIKQYNYACETDQLTAAQATARNNWAYNCGYIGYQQWQWNKFNKQKKARSAPFYPTFVGQFDESNWQVAPVKVTEKCSKETYKHLRHIKFCRAVMPADQNQICQEKREFALNEGMIGQDEYNDAVKENMAPVFHKDGSVAALQACKDQARYQSYYHESDMDDASEDLRLFNR